MERFNQSEGGVPDTGRINKGKSQGACGDMNPLNCLGAISAPDLSPLRVLKWVQPCCQSLGCRKANLGENELGKLMVDDFEG